MSNRVLLLRPAAVQRIQLLDDAADQPDGDWEIEHPIEGLPLEVYRDLADLWSASNVGAEDGQFSDKFKATLADIQREYGWEDEGELIRVLHWTTVFHRGGQVTSAFMEAQTVHQTFYDADIGVFDRFVYLEYLDGGLEIFIHVDDVCFIEMPLIDLIDEGKREIAELEAELAS